MRTCDVCRKNEATMADYRFIDSCGFQGKIASCKWCINLNDVTVMEVVARANTLNPIDPEEYLKNWEENDNEDRRGG
tara:strand:+ start:1573 stop:1803 length:231 start_codon:yes stop_codon:yes gene_type:complete